MKLPGNSRQIVRDAVRTALRAIQPDLTNPIRRDADLLLAGRKINDLPNAELVTLAQTLGLDVAALVFSSTTPVFTGTLPTRVPIPGADHIMGATMQEDDITTDTNRDAYPAAYDDAADTARDDTQSKIAAASATPEDEALTLRRELATAMVEGDFDGLTSRLTRLIQDARKPAETIRVEVERVVYRDGTAPVDVVAASPVVARIGTWGNTFGTKDKTMSRRPVNVYTPHPTTPKIDERYQWPSPTTEAALCAMGRNRNVWLYGPAGTGKSTFGEQLAARTGRPFFLIACDDTTEAPELLGMTVPHAGGVRWQDGVLTAAIRVPNAVILVDEPTVTRPGALMVLQSVLQSRMLSIKETSELVKAAPGVRFLVADNTNGTGGGAAEGYEGTRRLNRATLDRFASFLRLSYMEPDDEARALVSHTTCQPALAKMLVECAGLTRKAKVTHALGLRRLIAWAEALTDGIPPRVAFEISILNACAKDDREPTEQCCALGLDKRAVNAALLGTVPASAAPVSPPSARQSQTGADFAE